MTAAARMVVLDLRSITPYRNQALVMIAVTRPHLTVVSVASLQPWLPVIWVAGAAAFAASAATAVTVDARVASPANRGTS